MHIYIYIYMDVEVASQKKNSKKKDETGTCLQRRGAGAPAFPFLSSPTPLHPGDDVT